MRILFYFRQCLFAMLAPITALASPYSVEVLADNPVAFYRFNETPGATVALDASPRGTGLGRELRHGGRGLRLRA